MADPVIEDSVIEGFGETESLKSFRSRRRKKTQYEVICSETKCALPTLRGQEKNFLNFLRK